MNTEKIELYDNETEEKVIIEYEIGITEKQSYKNFILETMRIYHLSKSSIIKRFIIVGVLK